MSLTSFGREFLSFVEKEEEKLLSWGFYDAFFTAEEMWARFDSHASTELRDEWAGLSSTHSRDELISELEAASLIFATRPGRFRSRFAEGTRLLAHLRQRFRPEDWATGPRLVSDIKMSLIPRRYPRRDQSAEVCWAEIEPLCSLPNKALQRAAFHALSSSTGGASLSFAGFQRRAFSRIFEKYGERGFSGSVVSAGTGSGKTKAFYIPAFLRMLPELSMQPFTKVIAIYPRNVLLADQLREALSEAAKLRPVLAQFGQRALRFGALHGDVPEASWLDNSKDGSLLKSWRRVATGYVVPIVKSPIDGKSDLLWRDSDRAAGRTCLYRADGDGTDPEISDGVLILTRDQLRSTPPDVLFLSLEMLNRLMGDPGWQRTFGMRQNELGPRLLLLDELHAYEGLSGAQAAWILRRWRYWSGVKKLHVVGLSATLKEAPRYLSRVAAIPASRVREFYPRAEGEENEMEQEGLEYNLAIKGDPGSGASLLGTSIQTGMLLTRLLTPRTQSPSAAHRRIKPEEFLARKVFGFTDNLDSVNRWFSDMSDAERKRLARLRLHPNFKNPPPVPAPTPTQLERMENEGQLWDMSRLIGHNLESQLNVSRCSSSDPGVNSNSDLIVATSSLEVGFDDPSVGAILHHKRPRSMSSFIQRKGRAGRQRGSRPWTVVVLSDYGSDRWAFQFAERLFMPEVDSLSLPMRNPYILRVQATYFLIDWIGHRVREGSPFRYLGGPGGGEPARRAQNILRDILEGGPGWEQFRADIARFYSYSKEGLEKPLTDADVASLLWNAPRPVLLHAIPYLLRKLEKNWSLADPAKGAEREDQRARRPLPYYLPSASFGELEFAEVQIEFPDPGPESASMNVARALYETCPGHVSKRFSLGINEPGWWHTRSVRLVGGNSLEHALDFFPDSMLITTVNGTSVYQPRSIHVEHRPQSVEDSSNGWFEWQSRLVCIGMAQTLPVFIDEPWRNIVSASGAFLHCQSAHIEALRFARTCRYELRVNRAPVRGCVRFEATVENVIQPEAVGFLNRVDGLYFKIAATHLHLIPTLPPDVLARFRSDYFLHLIKTDATLSEKANSFQVEWLWQISMAMLSATALRRHCSLADAQVRLGSSREAAARRVLEAIFQIQGVNEHGEEIVARRQKDLLQLWRDETVCARMLQLETVLWAPPDAAFNVWVTRRHVSTIAQAIHAAASGLSEQVRDDDLMVDAFDAPDGGADIFITETVPGGLGLIESIANEMRSDPMRFQTAVEHALETCSRHAATETLRAIGTIAATLPGGDLGQAFSEVRSAQAFGEFEQGRERLKHALLRENFPVSRSLSVSVVTQLLRPGSSRDTDILLHQLNKIWREKEAQLGLAIDARTFAYVCIHTPWALRRLLRLFQTLGDGSTVTEPQLYALLQQFLLLSCYDSCRNCLDHPSRFNTEMGRPSRALTRLWIGLEVSELRIEADDEQWTQTTRTLLRQNGRVRLVFTPELVSKVAERMFGLVTELLEVQYLLLPVEISSVKRSGQTMSVTLQLKGSAHA